MNDINSPFGQSTERQSTQVTALVTEAINLLQQNRVPEALAQASQALALGAPVRDLNLLVGVCKIRCGQEAAGITNIIEEARLFPDNTAAQQLLAQIQPQSGVNTDLRAVGAAIEQQIRSGQIIEALQALDRLCSGPAVAPGAHWIRAQCLNQVGRHEEALEALRRELEINPNHSEAYREFHALAERLGKRPPPQLPPEQRSYASAIPKSALDSIQAASHRFSYRGVNLIKNPFDYALYPMLLWQVKPRTIIEIGSKEGGSALWMADLLNNFGIDGHIFSADIVKVSNVSHPRVTFLEVDGRKLGQHFTPEVLRNLPRPWLIIEDADHSYETSLAVLNFFHPHLQGDEYIIIEDGIISDLGGDRSYQSGPHRALKEFLGANPGVYDIDSSYADFFGYNFTWCTNGFLKKRRYQRNPAVDPSLVRDFNTDDPAPQGIDSQMSPNERFQLYTIARSLPVVPSRPLRFVEIGSYAGASLLMLARALRHLGVPVEGFAVEPGGTSSFAEVVSQLRGTVHHLKAYSYDAIHELKARFAQDGNYPALIFVDGDHTYEGVRKDIELYHSLVAPGGYLVFHDYLPALNDENRSAILFHHAGNEPGIRRACQEVVEQRLGWPVVNVPLLYPQDPTQTQPHLPVIPGVFSTLRVYQRPR